jgi:hypothetical protein
MVDGFHASELLRATAAAAWVNTSLSPTADLSVIDSFVTPKQGGLLIDLSFTCSSLSGTTNTVWQFWVTVDNIVRGSLAAPAGLYFPHADITGTPGDSASLDVFAPLAAGTHTVGYTATRTDGGDGSLDCNINESALFVPFNLTAAAG